jgi:hypothetical protein
MLFDQLTLRLARSGVAGASSIADGLFHYYKMEEATGNNARVDQLGNGDWSATGSPTQATGKNNFGAGCSVGHYLSRTTSGLLPATFTLGFWLNPLSYTELSGNNTPIIVSSTAATGFDFTRGCSLDGNTNAVLTMYPGAGTATQTGDPLSTGSFHAVMIWATPTTFGFQIDGGADHTGTTSFARTSGTMFCSFSSTVGVNGVFDEMPVWNRVLSASERAAWYNAATGLFYPY